MKKSIIILIIIFLLISGGGIFAYNYISDNYSLRSKEMISYNNLYAMSVPSAWKKSSGASPDAVIAAESPNESAYAMMSVNLTNFDSGATVEDYVNSYIAKIGSSSDDPLVQVVTVPPAPLTMGNNYGYYFELDSASGGHSLHTWSFIFNVTGGYAHVNVVSAGENNSAMAETAKSIISSAKVIPADDEENQDNTEDSQTE